MPIEWTLKKWLVVTHDVYRATDLRQRIIERTGAEISLQAISSLLQGKPKALRVSTVEAICTTFGCKLSDFCEVVPSKAKRRPHRPHASHGKRQRTVEDFPSPEEFPSPSGTSR
jgi:DNA-binding Xre family transcriptional regulator